MVNMRPFGHLAAADPFGDLRRLQDEIGRLMGTLAPATPSTAGGFPAVNIYAGRDGIAVVAELPGVAKDDLDIQAHRDTLVLRGTRHPASEREDAYHRRERRSGTFTRSIQLPYLVDPSRVEAQLEDGVLRLSLPRPEEDRPRRITIAS